MNVVIFFEPFETKTIPRSVADKWWSLDRGCCTVALEDGEQIVLQQGDRWIPPANETISVTNHADVPAILTQWYEPEISGSEDSGSDESDYDDY